jgi:hypothetical protein
METHNAEYIPCKTCQGSGRITCAKCNGKEKHTPGRICSNCFGKSRTTCIDCEGEGKIKTA